MESIAQRHGFPLEWHPGFALAVDRVDAEFRGRRSRCWRHDCTGSSPDRAHRWMRR
nr:DUF3626 domain-containing protein [Micromonospora chokoriensis]